MAAKFLILAIAVSCAAAYPGYHDHDYYVRTLIKVKKVKICLKKNKFNFKCVEN